MQYKPALWGVCCVAFPCFVTLEMFQGVGTYTSPVDQNVKEFVAI